MNIKTRLSFQFTLIVVGILVFFSLLVYYFSFSSQLAKFKEDLYDGAKNTAILLVNMAEVDSSLLKKIHQSTISWEREEIVVTDSSFNLIYSNKVEYLSKKVIKNNSTYGNVHFFSVGQKDGVFYRHYHATRSYNVYVMASDNTRIENLTELRGILLWSILISVIFSVLMSYLFSRNAIQPISRIIKSVKNINSLRMSNRLNEGKRKDEIDQLAITFNEMLSNLEIAFRNQEDFVSNASHELRTPLSVMISESDYLLSHKRKQEEYIEHISKLINDLKTLNSMLNSLLELAQINTNYNILLTDIRIDEIVYNAIHQIKTKYSGRRIIPKIKYPENDNDLLIKGNAGLLTMAFSNLIDNACKFSDDEVEVEFDILDSEIQIRITDKGVGIPADEIDTIYMPFKRASNVRFKGGFGVGLSLVNKIIELHNSSLKVVSAENEGTSFEIIFKKANPSLKTS